MGNPVTYYDRIDNIERRIEFTADAITGIIFLRGITHEGLTQLEMNLFEETDETYFIMKLKSDKNKLQNIGMVEGPQGRSLDMLVSYFSSTAVRYFPTKTINLLPLVVKLHYESTRD